MKRPVLYLDVVGTLMLDFGGRMALAPFARSFMDQVKETFELRFLTSLEEHQALAISRALRAKVAFVPWSHALGKVSAIDFTEEFWWVDDDPSPADLLKLSDERRSDRLVPVTRREGVTEHTLAKLKAASDTLLQVSKAEEA